MAVKVAVVEINDDAGRALLEAAALLGGLEDLNTPAREVAVKIGLFDPKLTHHSSLEVVEAITRAFNRAPRVHLTESDNYCGGALDRLERFRPLCSERVTLTSLSGDPQARAMPVAGEQEPMALASVLFKPNVLVSTHVLRTFKMGSVLKNLFGCTPMVKKGKYHKKEIINNQMCDLFEAFGGIDLAVMDATFLHHGASSFTIPMNLLIVGRDAVAVETVGAVLAGLKPERMPILQTFAGRGLGVADMTQIELVGISAADFAERKKLVKQLNKQVEATPKKPGLSDTIDCLTQEGWMNPGRTTEQVAAELSSRGVTNTKKALVETTLKRRVGKTLERSKPDGSPAWIYRPRQDLN
jgi:hypothetical protein